MAVFVILHCIGIPVELLDSSDLTQLSDGLVERTYTCSLQLRYVGIFTIAGAWGANQEEEVGNRRIPRAARCSCCRDSDNQAISYVYLVRIAER